jgi:L-amino acid N-acyltransferase YncA
MKKLSKSQNKFCITIREAKATDAAGIAKVTVDTWRTTYGGIVPPDFLNSLSYEERTAAWQNRYSDSSKLWNGWFTYVAENNEGEVIGFAGGGPHRGDLPFSGELVFIYLLKSHQRHGIGSQLTATIASRLKQQGHNSMIVWVFVQNQYRSFYQALGGKVVGEKKVNYGGKNLREIAYGWQDLSMFEKLIENRPQ